MNFVKARKVHMKGNSVKLSFLKNTDFEYSLRDRRRLAKNSQYGQIDTHMMKKNSSIRAHSL